MFGRPQGVTLPASQLQGERGEPNTVYHAVPMLPVAIEYTDENGVRHKTVVYKVGKAVYIDMNADRWAAGLRPAAAYIADVVNKEIDSQAASVPSRDTVSVMGAHDGQDPKVA
jgi:hypothetical protein